MNEFKELLKELQGLSIEQTNSWEEDIPNNIWEKYFKEAKELKSNLDIAKHRWYEVSTTVISVCGGLLGIRSVTDLFSEGMSIDDCGVTLEFFEMKEVPSITYKRI